MHVETVEKQVGLVSHALAETLKLGLVHVALENGLVDLVGALVNDDAGSLPRAQTADIGEAGLGHDDVEVVLGLVDVGAHGNDAGHTVRVGLAGAGGGSMHDAVLGAAKEIGRATETVEHTAAQDAGRVGVRIDIHLNGRVHADDTKAADNLRRVADLLRAKEQLALVLVPVVVKTLEALGGEADRGGSGEVKLAGVKKIKEGVLDDLGPDLHVFELGVAETANDGVGNVTDTGLEGQEVLGEAAVLDLMLQELNEMASDGLRVLVGRAVRESLILSVGVDNTDHLLRVEWDGSPANPVLDVHDEVRFAVRRQVGHGDIVKALHTRERSIDLNNDLWTVSMYDNRLAVRERA